MAIGPVEYIIVGFPGTKFTGEIAPELIALVESGTVKVLDLIFIGKDDEGNVLAFEIDELDEVAGFSELEGSTGGSSVPRTSSSRRRSSSPTPRRPCSSGKMCGRLHSPRREELGWGPTPRCSDPPRADRPALSALPSAV